MPNTPVRVCAGVFLLEEKAFPYARGIRAGAGAASAIWGWCSPVESRLLGIAGTLSGCGPAFVSMFIEALGDAGVALTPAAGHSLPPCQPDGGGHGPMQGARTQGRDEGRSVLARRHDH